MKRIIATIGLLCVGLSGAGHETNAQVTINIFNLNDVLRAKPIDETRFTVQYQTTSMPDTLQPDKKEEETLMLKVGDKCSVYYSYAKFLTDSVLEADKAAGASQEVINEHLQRYSSKTNAQVYKNYPAGKTTTLDALAASLSLRGKGGAPGMDLTARYDDHPVLSLPESDLSFQGQAL